MHKYISKAFYTVIIRKDDSKLSKDFITKIDFFASC